MGKNKKQKVNVRLEKKSSETEFQFLMIC